MGVPFYYYSVMNNKEYINGLSKFAEKCTQTSKKRGRIRGIQKYYKAYFNERRSNTLIELYDENTIKAIATYHIVETHGKLVFVFTTIFCKKDKGNFKEMRAMMKKIKSFGFDKVCILREDWSLLCHPSF